MKRAALRPGPLQVNYACGWNTLDLPSLAEEKLPKKPSEVRHGCPQRGTELPFGWTTRMSACHYPTLHFVEKWLIAPMSNEREKQHIDNVRDSALSMQIGDENDGSISQMVNVANADMYIIKKHAIFRVFLADDIDPERTNISIPNGHQRIASQGSDSEIVARSFLTANALFNSNQFDGPADVKQIIDLSIAVMKELLAAQNVESEFTRDRSNALAAFQQPKQRSVALPSVEGLNERLKTFVQKIEHANQAIYRFSQQFYDHTKRDVEWLRVGDTETVWRGR
ncbi:hypothetical protein [uncultured Paracoccus sp.]|uniref:hypothetical protein n=1 Tax=uncultured Paracoccus sp. TaxID=189685 RepID=UPI00262AB611|nr:hypothetical protein [uncultured Paracoccus sp.]